MDRKRSIGYWVSTIMGQKIINNVKTENKNSKINSMTLDLRGHIDILRTSHGAAIAIRLTDHMGDIAFLALATVILGTL